MNNSLSEMLELVSVLFVLILGIIFAYNNSKTTNKMLQLESAMQHSKTTIMTSTNYEDYNTPFQTYFSE